MKTRKTLRTTGLIQLVYCAFILVQMVISMICARYQIPVSRDSMLFKIIDLYGGLATIVWYVPTAIPCFIFNLAVFLKERKDLEVRRYIGLQWLWMPIALLLVLAIKYLYLWYTIISILYQDHFPV